MSPLLFTLQTDFDTIWLNCTEEHIELQDLAKFAMT